MIDDAKLLKLPKWAQDHIRQLTNNLSYLANELEEIKGNLPESNTIVRKYLHEIKSKKLFYLDDYARLLFVDSTKYQVEVNVNYGKPGIRVDIGSHGVVIPIARNVIEIHKSNIW